MHDEEMQVIKKNDPNSGNELVETKQYKTITMVQQKNDE